MIWVLMCNSWFHVMYKCFMLNPKTSSQHVVCCVKFVETTDSRSTEAIFTDRNTVTWSNIHCIHSYTTAVLWALSWWNKTTMSEERIGSGRLESLEHLKLDAADLLKACQRGPNPGGALPAFGWLPDSGMKAGWLGAGWSWVGTLYLMFVKTS